VLLGSPNRVSIRNLGDVTWTDAQLMINGQRAERRTSRCHPYAAAFD
jgi:hypothetical protein